jgi:phosphatidylethanolamine/phosphatidyl-N-methylethanolamine N-methyltransferase
MNPAAQRAAIYGPEQVRAAYARLAATYDYAFGPLLNHARLAAVSAVNALPGADVLEVGVGTGLALLYYRADKRITGIDLSSEMLRKAGTRAAKLPNIESLLKMDAQATSFTDNRFDIAAVMFVASVTPDPRGLMAELRRIVKPGGRIVILNHFAADHGVRLWLERSITPVCGKLGWRADFRLGDLLDPSDLQGATTAPLRPFGLFRLVELKN